MPIILGLYHLYETLVDYVFNLLSPLTTTMMTTTTFVTTNTIGTAATPTSTLLVADMYDSDESDPWVPSTQLVASDSDVPVLSSFPIDRTWDRLLNLSLGTLLVIVAAMATALLIRIARYHRPHLHLLRLQYGRVLTLRRH